jgi:hypothetical protein
MKAASASLTNYRFGQHRPTHTASRQDQKAFRRAISKEHAALKSPVFAVYLSFLKGFIAKFPSPANNSTAVALAVVRSFSMLDTRESMILTV